LREHVLDEIVAVTLERAHRILRLSERRWQNASALCWTATSSPAASSRPFASSGARSSARRA
jgi:hypothetical protein